MIVTVSMMVLNALCALTPPLNALSLANAFVAGALFACFFAELTERLARGQE